MYPRKSLRIPIVTHEKQEVLTLLVNKIFLINGNLSTVIFEQTCRFHFSIFILLQNIKQNRKTTQITRGLRMIFS